MAINYIVYYGTAAATNNGTNALSNGWTEFGGQISTTTDQITGLAGGTNYYFRVFAVDTVTGIQSTAAQIGPLSTSSGEAAEGLVINTAGPSMNASTTTGSVDASGPFAVFTLTGSSGAFVVDLNGSATPSSGVTEIVYHNHACYQTSAEGWWYWNTATAAWVQYLATVTFTPGSTYAANAPANTVVGTFAITMFDGSGYTGTPTVSDSTNSFAISGSNIIATKPLTVASYTITVTAPPLTAGSTTVGAIATASGTVTETGTTTMPAQPAAAKNAGFNTLAFFDDFTNASKIALTTQIPQSTAFNWYLDGRSPASDVTTSFMSAANTAVNTPGGTAGAGTAPSPGGGIIKILGVLPNATIMTLAPATYISVNPAPTPVVGHGCWGPHWYAEAYIQTVPGTSFANSGNNGWPAWWSWAALGIQEYNGTPANLVSNPTEIDFFESFGVMGFNNFGGEATDGWAMSLLTHGSGSGGGEVVVANGGGNSPGAQFAVDGNYHAYGCLWTPGTLTSYYDGQVMGTISTANTAMETSNQTFFLVLGTGSDWPIYVDYVWVWTA